MTPKMEIEVADKYPGTSAWKSRLTPSGIVCFEQHCCTCGALEICGTRGVEVGKDIDADNTEVSNKRLCPSRDLGRR